MDNTRERQKVLIVDDEAVNIEVLNEILLDDYRVLFATNGADALAVVRSQRPDIILLDIMMPGMDGREVCRRLKADPGTSAIPVVFITAMTGEKEERIGLEMGAVDYIYKPINPDVVRLRVKNQLELQQHRSELEKLVDQRTHELKLAKEAAEAGNRAKNEFLSVISHELRTPLTAILGYADLLNHMALEPKALDFIETIARSGQSLLGIINEILSYVKIESKEYVKTSQSFLLSELINKTTEGIVESIGSKPIVFTARIDEGMPDAVMGDRTRLGHVLRHLLNNAVKFTGEGSILLTVEPAAEGAGDHWLHFAIEDTGIGIPPEKHEEIFQHFTVLESALTRSREGIGLGLTVCKRYVSQMGGRIWLESRAGSGSTFHFVLQLPPREWSD